MESLIAPVAALVMGIAFGYALGARGKHKKSEGDEVRAGDDNWWEMRKTLTGTQLQILQYMEAKKSASITSLQEKFSFIPDRELYYRLEQIVLMGFVIRGRKEGDTVYNLNEEYALTVEDDKTVMLPDE
jgi:hypothetical protein